MAPTTMESRRSHPVRRRRTISSIIRLAVFILIVLPILFVSFSARSNSNFVDAKAIGIDLGSEAIKASVFAETSFTVDVILNDMSNRKTAHFVGIRDGERYVGEDAKNLAPRFPEKMLSMLHRFLGGSLTKEKEEWTRSMLLPFSIHNSSRRDAIAFTVDSSDPEKGTFEAVELLAMVLSHIRRTAEFYVKGPVQEAVIVLPGAFSYVERQSVVDAAAAAGLTVTALVPSTVAAAYQFSVLQHHEQTLKGKSNSLPTQTFFMLDIGSTQTEASVFEVKHGAEFALPRSKNGWGTIRRLSLVGNTTYGGRSFDLCLAQHIEHEALTKAKIQPFTSSLKTLAEKKGSVSLMRAAMKAKEVLSVNKAASITVENMAPGRDYQSSVGKDVFEQHCHFLFEGIRPMLEAAVLKAKIKSSKIERFQVIGGAHRMPKMLQQLQDFFGRPIDRTLNADEAAVVGAGYLASMHSGISLARGTYYAIQEPLGFNVTMRHTKDQKEARTLFSAEEKYPISKQLKMVRKRDFPIFLYLHEGERKEDLPPISLTVNITGVERALNSLPFFEDPIVGDDTVRYRLKHRNNTFHIIVILRINSNRLVEVMNATLHASYVVRSKKRLPPSTVDPNTTAKQNCSNDTKEEREGEKSECKHSTPAEPQFEFVEKLRRRKLPLDFTLSGGGDWWLMDTPHMTASLERLKHLDDQEALRRAAASMKNELEMRLYRALNEDLPRLLSDASLNDKGRAAINSGVDALTNMQNWLGEAEDDTLPEAFKEKIVQAEEIVKGVQAALDESGDTGKEDSNEKDQPSDETPTEEGGEQVDEKESIVEEEEL